MKTTPVQRFFCLLFSLFAVQSLSAADYYWVGGTGNWSNFQYHWATSSGGSTFHTIPPTQNDDVYFDQNSFTGPGQTVTLNVQYAYCRNMDWTGVQYDPTWAGETEMNIYGSFILAQDMQLAFSNVNIIYFKLRATTPGQVINTYGHPLGHPTGGARVEFLGQGGEWTLENDFDIGSSGTLYFTNGSLITNGHALKALDMLWLLNSPNRIDLGTSTLTGVSIWFQGADTTALDADSTTIIARDLTIDQAGKYHIARVSGDLYGPFTQTAHFDDVELHAANATDKSLAGHLVYHDRLHIADSGRTLLVGGSHTILNQFTARTRPGFPIRIKGGLFIKSSGDLCFEWLYLENNSAVGGANWYAGWQSSDLGGNNGWLFSSNDSCSALVSVEDPLAFQALWSPNPVHNNEQLRVDFSTEATGEVILKLFDLQGRLLWTEHSNLPSGQHRMRVPAELLARGSYLGEIETGAGVHRQVLVVQ